MELPHIGENCVVCNRNDYLPFKCSKCDKVICIDHKFDHGSDCPLQATSFDNRPAANQAGESLRQRCDHCKRITLRLELSECPQCQTFNCLYHRHQVQHNCPRLSQDLEQHRSIEARKQEKRDEAINQLKNIVKQVNKPSSSLSKQAPVDPKKRSLANRVRLMKLRMSAKGPPNILEQDKIFFEIKFVHEPQSPLSVETKDGCTVRVFATAKHTIGRLIDWSADELGLQNKNYMPDTDQLVFKRVSDVGDSIILSSSASFGSYLDDAKLENGDQLLITYDVLK